MGCPCGQVTLHHHHLRFYLFCTWCMEKILEIIQKLIWSCHFLSLELPQSENDENQGRPTTQVFSSPEPLGSQGELIVYPCSVVVVVVVVDVHTFQSSSSLKPLGQSNLNFMWSILMKKERKFI